MKRETAFINPLISTVDADELAEIYARMDVRCLTCMGIGIYSFMKHLISNIREGRIGGTLVFCKIRFGKDSGLDLGNIRRLLLPFSNISETQWILIDRARSLIEVEYVFKRDGNNKRMTEEKALLLLAGVDEALKKCDFNYEDAATYRLLQEGKTDGVFFMEGAFNQYDLRQLKPTNLDELTAACAFSHPLTNDGIYKYLKNKEIRSDGDYYGIPEVDEVLKETNGIFLYKEQGQEIEERLDKILASDKTELHSQAGFIKSDIRKHQG